MDKKSGLKLNIGIIHPDLGIGGAERLIVDAAVELASHGHNVHIFTAHHDKNRCFEETLAGTFPVTVYGSFLPRHIFQHFHALCAYLRCIFVAICMLFMWTSFDVVLVDQVSVVIPLMKLKKSSKVVFYCHFPDLLLAQHGTSLRRVYRKPIDFVEEVTTGMADLILVNSKFTATTFAKTFKRLDSQAVRPAVLYPAVNVEQFTTPDAFKLNLLSINRFERKKNIELAISAFSMLCKDETNVLQGHNLANATLTVAGKSPDILQPETRHHISEHMNEVMPRGLFNIIAFFDCSHYKSTCWPKVFVFKLMDNYFHSLTRTPNGVSVSGGFDRRLRENVEYLEELKVLAEREGVSPRVRFITSCSTSERNTLLSQCLCVLYTPKDEHFGIVPLEAMAAHKPVMSCNSGGPVETIKDGVTGFLCEPNPEAFSSAMSKFIREPQLAESMGKEARRHVEESFSTKIFGQNLNRYLVDIVREKND